MHRAGINCKSQVGGACRRSPGTVADGFGWYAFAFATGDGIVDRDVREVEVGLAESIIGNHGNGTEAPLPSRNDGVYVRSVLDVRIELDVSVDVSSGSLSFSAMAPDERSTRHQRVAKVSAVRRGRQAPAGSEREASCMRKGEREL